jgi:putative transposase
MPSKNIITPIQQGKYYHIFNRGNNFEKVFYSHQDYLYFLLRLKFHMKFCCKIYAFALLPNHYHLLLRIKEDIDHHLFSVQLKKVIQEYTYKINDRENRNGNLFLKPFRRLEITSDEYFKHLVYYIHADPYKHKICNDFKRYDYSSYKSIIATAATHIKRIEVLNWFRGKDEFIEFHKALHSEKII